MKSHSSAPCTTTICVSIVTPLLAGSHRAIVVQTAYRVRSRRRECIFLAAAGLRGSVSLILTQAVIIESPVTKNTIPQVPTLYSSERAAWFAAMSVWHDEDHGVSVGQWQLWCWASGSGLYLSRAHTCDLTSYCTGFCRRYE